MDRTELTTDHESQRLIVELEQRVASLERANQDLWRTNQRLGRDRLGTQGSAAASIAARLDAAEAEVERMERSLSWRLTTPLRLPRRIARWVLRRIRPVLRSVASRFLR